MPESIINSYVIPRDIWAPPAPPAPPAPDLSKKMSVEEDMYLLRETVCHLRERLSSLERAHLRLRADLGDKDAILLQRSLG